jgi:hypothetical protein
MNARQALIFSTWLATAAALLSCTANGGSIYATIETERKVIDSTLPKTLTIQDVVKTGAAAPYFVAGGAIYNGKLPDANNVIGWPTVGQTAVPIELPGSGALCTALALFNGELWAGFFTSGSVLGLFYSTGRSFAGAGAVQVPDPVVAGKQVTLLEAANGNLFVVAATVSPGAYVYELDYYSGATFTWTQLVSGFPRPITGVAWDGTSYLMVSGVKLYTAPLADPPVFDAGISTLGSLTVDAADDLRGVFADGTWVLIPTKSGGVYLRDSAAIWSQIAADVINGNKVPYLTVAGPVDGAGDKYLVGSDGYGYYTLSASAKTVARFSDNTIALYTTAVRRILTDSATVFMGTSGNGLWRATFDLSTGALKTDTAWIHE